MDSPVSISGLLREERIVVGLNAASYREAVGRLLDRLDAAGLISDWIVAPHASYPAPEASHCSRVVRL